MRQAAAQMPNVGHARFIYDLCYSLATTEDVFCMQGAAASSSSEDADVAQDAAQINKTDEPLTEDKSRDPTLPEQNVGTDVKR